MSLCEVCEKIPFFDLPPFPPWLEVYYTYKANEEHSVLPLFNWSEETQTGALGIAYHKSIEALRASAPGCMMCRLVEYEILGSLEGYRRIVHQYHRFRNVKPNCELWTCKRRAGEDGFIILSPLTGGDGVYLMAAAGFCVEDGT